MPRTPINRYLSIKEIDLILALSRKGFDVIIICPKTERMISPVERIIYSSLKRCAYRGVSYIYNQLSYENIDIYGHALNPIFIKCRNWHEGWNEEEENRIEDFLRAYEKET